MPTAFELCVYENQKVINIRLRGIYGIIDLLN